MTKKSAPRICAGPGCTNTIPGKRRRAAKDAENVTVTHEMRGRAQRYGSQRCRARAYRSRHTPSLQELRAQVMEVLEQAPPPPDLRAASLIVSGAGHDGPERLEELRRGAVAMSGAIARMRDLLGLAPETTAPAQTPGGGESVTDTSVTKNPGPGDGPAPATAPSPGTGAAGKAPAVGADGLRPTAEQDAIVQACARGANTVVVAGAGTGKTTMLKLAAAAMGGRGLYVAFNRSIAAEARRKMPANVTASTAHSLAFRSVGHRYKHRLDGPRVPAKRAAEILGISGPLQVGETKLSAAKQASLAMEMVTRFCHSDARDIDLSHAPFVHGLTRHQAAALAGHLLPLARDAWADLQRERGGELKFGHDHYLKLWALGEPDLECDFVLFDEAQDANPVIAKVVRRQAAQQIVVGDSAQQIYGWRGAVDALETWPADVRLKLTRSFRFGERIAAEANAWLAELGADLRLEGNPAMSSQVGALASPEAVLCRTNAVALSRAMEAMDAGRRAALVGGGTAIQRLAEAARDLQAGRGTAHPELFAFTSWGEVQAYVTEEREAAGDLATFVRLIDDHGPDKVIAATRRLADEKHAQVVLSTAHKAKGREWPSVQIADDFREPAADPETGEPRPVPRADAMLAYVSVTRAMENLDNSGLAWIHNRTTGTAGGKDRSGDDPGRRMSKRGVGMFAPFNESEYHRFS